ncbi:MAG TPA: NrfD/PsrC family molybdoenzyme membrane anchor subunit [Bryobacteraceae bacterium]|jgi:formate-dependent nitrite reductase membrane component NrfD|nr:NrfD/PsrC family molybdoenzyme membrane anchor subunit [Bryobacteraceae bacterium]
MSEPPNDLTYYNRPLLKESVWSIDIPLYYFLGGSAGAAMTLAAALQLASEKGQSDLRRVSAVCHWTGIVGSTLGAVFLVHDLGRPERFLYMMRVFRPTSPMNMGVWILSGAAPASIAAGLLANRRGILGAVGEACGYVAGVFGAALAGYTGVLVSTTAIPVWQAARRWMPVLFLASSASSAAGLIETFAESEAARKVTRVFGTAGRVAELAAAHQVERAASAVPRVGQPLREGATSILWRGATLLTAASLAASLLPGKSRTRRVAAGVLAMAGSLCLRLAVHYVGDASARDARASFQQQRAGEA